MNINHHMSGSPAQLLCSLLYFKSCVVSGPAALKRFYACYLFSAIPRANIIGSCDRWVMGSWGRLLSAAISGDIFPRCTYGRHGRVGVRYLGLLVSIVGHVMSGLLFNAR